MFENKWLTYIGEDGVALVANASLQTEGQVMAADHDAAAEALLKRLHIRFDPREVQPLHDNRGMTEKRQDTQEKETETAVVGEREPSVME